MRHKHRNLIHAWADGAEIEYKDRRGIWRIAGAPDWSVTTEYRIKPEGEGLDDDRN